MLHWGQHVFFSFATGPRPRSLPLCSVFTLHLLGEAFLRLPPDDPACLLRASLACKRWRHILADPAFRRRHRELHRTPSVVGFLSLEKDAPYASRFVPDNSTSVRPAARDLPGRLVLDCRHGRALFLAPFPSLGAALSYDLVVWDPLTNEHRCLPRPSPLPSDTPCNAAVLCAASQGCDHRKCHGCPFRVALLWNQDNDIADPVMCASVYSSEEDNWSEPISVQHPYAFLCMMPCPSTLVGDTLYFHYGFNCALEYQLGAQHLSLIEGPPRSVSQIRAFLVMPMQDGRLGCMATEDDESSGRLQLWSREAASGSDGVARWTRGRAIDLEQLLPNGALPSPRWPSDPHSRFHVTLLGFAEGTDVIFVSTWARNHPGAVYMVNLNSGRSSKVFDRCTVVVPYTSFCIPVTDDASSTTEGPGDDASGA